MSTKKQKLMKMVRELRQHLGLTQTEFAEKLGQGMSTIQRYEQLVPPRGRALARIITIAEKAGRHDIADGLRGAYADEVTDNTAKAWIQLGAQASYELDSIITDLESARELVIIGRKKMAAELLESSVQRLKQLKSSGETKAVPQLELPEGDATR
jgi:transcriptional regulator with XRE-family HTH domain